MNDGGVSFSVKISFAPKATADRIGAILHEAQKKLDIQIVKDCNYYVPLKTGTLQKSALIYTVPGSGQIVYRTPYAKRQYYGLHFDHSKQLNPNACAKWFEAAKARKEEDWRRLVEDEVKRG